MKRTTLKNKRGLADKLFYVDSPVVRICLWVLSFFVAFFVNGFIKFRWPELEGMGWFEFRVFRIISLTVVGMVVLCLLSFCYNAAEWIFKKLKFF